MGVSGRTREGIVKWNQNKGLEIPDRGRETPKITGTSIVIIVLTKASSLPAMARKVLETQICDMNGQTVVI